MLSPKEQNKVNKRDRKQSKRQHGMRIDRRPTDIGNAVSNRADDAKNKRNNRSTK